MASYHLSAKIVKRSAGQSAVAHAAYIAREKFENERTGEVFDYSRAKGLLFSGIFAPENAPDWAQDRGQLWNEVERFEKRSNSQLARSLTLALPHELTDEQRKMLLTDFVRENFTRKGMVADVNIHAPSRGGDQRNYHAHIALTMRGFDQNGEWAQEKNGGKARPWNSKDELTSWRKNLAKLSNRYLDRFGHLDRVDHRSLENQGIEREPTQHLGPDATHQERQGKGSERGDINREIEARNNKRASMLAQRQEIIQELEQAKKTKRFFTEEELRACFKVQPRRQIEQVREMVAQGERLKAYREQIIRKVEEEKAKAQAELQQEARQEGQAGGFGIANPKIRYGQALAQNFPSQDHYGSLARSAMTEYGTFLKERDTLNARIDEASPEERRLLEKRKRIEEFEYMAITTDRIADQNEIITGRRNTEEAQKCRQQAQEERKEAQELRGQYREHSCTEIAREMQQDRRQAPPQPSPIMVQERKPGQKRGPEQTLDSFVKTMPEKKESAIGKKDIAQRLATQRRERSLDNMSRDIKAGRPVAADDLRGLSKEDLAGLNFGGAPYLQELIRRREQAKDRGLER